MKKIAALIIAGLLMSGCAGTSGGTDADPPNGSNSDEGSAEKQEKPKKEEPPKFGQAYTWDDGITVKVSKPKPFKPSEYSSFDEQPDYLKFEIRVINKSGETFDVSSFTSSLQSGNEEMEEVFDSENGFDGSPTTKLLDGRESKFKIGYGVKDKSDLVLQISPDFEKEAVIYTS